MSARRLAHPIGGWIVPMAGEPEQFRHVIRHLYAAKERWDLVPTLPADTLRRHATQAGCRPSELAVDKPSYYSAPIDCRQHVLADYHERYEPAYWSAVQTALAEQQWGCDQADQAATLFVGSNAVFVMTRRKSRPSDGTPLHVVVSARRHTPRDIRWQEARQEDFFATGPPRSRPPDVLFAGAWWMSERAGDDAQALRSGNEQGVRDAIAELQKPEVGHYRTLVLLGRLVQLAAVGHTIDARLLPAAWQGLLVDPQPMPALDELTARAVFPNEHELGLELLAECAAGEDAIASVQPMLLAIEDHLDVLSLLGLSERAALLVQTTVAAVALFPEVMSALGARAEIQLAGLSGRSEAATLWSAVLSASGWLAAAAMEVSPTLSREGRAYFHLAKQATKDAKPRGSFRLPLHVALPEWQRAAATTRASVDVPLLDADGVEVASLFLDSRDGHEKICLPLPAATPASLHISLLIYDRELRQERGRQQLITEQKGAELIADLGHPVGPSSIRHQLLGRRAADLPEHRVQFLIEVAQDVV